MKHGLFGEGFQPESFLQHVASSTWLHQSQASDNEKPLLYDADPSSFLCLAKHRSKQDVCLPGSVDMSETPKACQHKARCISALVGTWLVLVGVLKDDRWW